MVWLGTILLIGISTWMGFEWSSHLKHRPIQIRQLKHALQLLEAEILYNQNSLQNAFLFIAKRIDDPTKSFFANLAKELDGKTMDFNETWKRILSQFKTESSLHQGEIEIMEQFGRTLGKQNIIQQQKQIKLAITHLEQELEIANSQASKYGNMSKVLGFLIGLFITILII